MLVGLDGTVEGWLPYRRHLTMVTGGRRHVMMGASQIDRLRQPEHLLHRRLGAADAPAARACAARPVNTLNNPISYWVPKHSAAGLRREGRHGVRCRLRPRRRRGPGATRFHRIPRVVSDLGVFDFADARTARCGWPPLHPGVTVEQVREATGFELAVARRGPVHPRADRATSCG